MTWLKNAQDWCVEFEANWIKAKSNTEFWDFASKSMATRKWSDGFNLNEVIHEFFTMDQLPVQLNVESKFGEPPLTLFSSSSENFVLDLYVWQTAHTSVHQHGFEGAFCVLEGKSIESSYSFNKIKSVGKNSTLGKLVPVTIETITPDQIKPIKLFDDLIHRVIHLNKPTVSLVMRTKKNSDRPQLSYSYGCLASPSFIFGAETLKVRILDWMMKQETKPHFNMIQSMLDYYQTWAVLLKDRNSILWVKKLALFYFGEELLPSFNKEFSYIELLKLSRDSKSVLILTAIEFFGAEGWQSWIKNEISLDEKEALAYLKTEFTKNYPDFDCNDLMKHLGVKY